MTTNGRAHTSGQFRPVPSDREHSEYGRRAAVQPKLLDPLPLLVECRLRASHADIGVLSTRPGPAEVPRVIRLPLIAAGKWTRAAAATTYRTPAA